MEGLLFTERKCELGYPLATLASGVNVNGGVNTLAGYEAPVVGAVVGCRKGFGAGGSPVYGFHWGTAEGVGCEWDFMSGVRVVLE